jgi:carbonic anhydrase
LKDCNMISSSAHEDPRVQKDSASVTRRRLLTGIGLATAGTAAAGLAIWRQAALPIDHHGFSMTTPQTAAEALARLRAGNECYIQEHFSLGNRGRTAERRTEIAPAQHPYAIVLACADSRVPPEIVFSAGLGDLFVVRVAGNIVDPKCLGVLGSIEYAIEELKIPLIFALGHEGCGAVKAAIHAVEQGKQPPSAISVLTDAIRPVVESIAEQPGDLLQNAVAANVRHQVENLLRSKAIVAPAVASKRVQIAGGVYELETGRVQLLSESG